MQQQQLSSEPTSKLHRRGFLKLSGLGALSLAAAALLKPVRADASVLRPASLGRPFSAQTFTPDVEIALTAEPAQVAILPGQPTTVWRYRAQVISGPGDAVQPIPDTYLGPIFRFTPGQKVRIRFTNGLAEESIVHWHGLHVPEAADGHPRLVIAPGEEYVYEYEIMDRPGTYWYHPHPHGRTGPQAYMGLAGLILISDASEQALGLPSGDRDLPVVIQDRTFDSQNQLVYNAPMAGFLGDRILVNGQPDAAWDVEPATYRLRILNGSNSRIYKLAWPDGSPLTVIATDGGLLDAPVQRPYITLGPAERAELLVDFSPWAGQTLTLRSLAFSGGGFNGGGPGPGPNQTTLPNGAAFTVMRFRVGASAPALPYKTFMPLMAGPATALGRQRAVWTQADRTFQLYMQFGQWTINGRTFQMEAVAPDETVTLGTQEVWEFVNQQPNGGMGGGMPHPMHIHGLQFRVIGRQPPANAQQRANWETVKDGYVDDGWKDTVLLMPGERVQVQLAFEDFTGLYLYHCHNLEHEDMGMMRNYRVVAPAS